MKQTMKNHKENKSLQSQPGVRSVRGVWCSASLQLIFTAHMTADELLYMPERQDEKNVYALKTKLGVTFLKQKMYSLSSSNHE